MAYWGGATAGGWSHSHYPSGGRPGAGLKRSVDGWDDDELGRAIDHYIPSGDRGGVGRVGAILVALAVVGWLGQFVQQVTTAFMGHHVLLRLRTQMFDHIQKLSLSFLDRSEVGRVMSRVQNDVTVLQDLLTTGILTIMADFVGLGLVVFFLLFLDVPLALITFTVIP